MILAFATADPKVQVFSDQGGWYLLGSASRPSPSCSTCAAPTHPWSPAARCGVRRPGASLLVSFFIGAALIAALIDIPLFARTTIYRDSQLMAALVLVRFLVALPVGAVIGGYLTRSVPAGVVTAVGMACAAGGFGWMTTWELDTLESFSSNIPLVLCGFGFGLALAPVNAALLASTDDDVHGLASALVVVARMVGMLVGISALTTIGLRRYYSGLDENPLPPPREVCDGKTRCTEFSDMLAAAGIAQEHTVFAGAAVCAVVAGVLALVLFRTANTRALDAARLLRAAG